LLAVPWNVRATSGEAVASGLHFYRLSVNGASAVTKKMVLMQ
jgi:hypothetical protein